MYQAAAEKNYKSQVDFMSSSLDLKTNFGTLDQLERDQLERDQLERDESERDESNHLRGTKWDV